MLHSTYCSRPALIRQSCSSSYCQGLGKNTTFIIVVANTQSTNSILAAPARYLYACKGPINLQQQVVQNHFFQRLNEILFFFPFYFLSSHACVFSPEKLGWYGSSGPFYKNEMDVFRRHERRKSLSTFSSLFSLAYRGTL